ncbi:myoglobin [Topomyia yanbarensis]|uniref:myoglobin n=1 Tax=Topomyia yanbarensis TaxID=2498891 RepID=UPI00273B2D27|nr:myoglobin [Topomyia yanbarensis]
MSDTAGAGQSVDYSSPDDTGLTKAQKVALVGAWSVIKRDIVVHGRNIFVRFFEEHPNYLKYFDFSQDSEATEMKDNKSLHAHVLNVMQFLGILIEYGLENPVMFKCSLSKMVRNHKRRGIGRTDIEALSDAIRKYCLQALENHRSKTLDEALSKFMELIMVGFE